MDRGMGGDGGDADRRWGRRAHQVEDEERLVAAFAIPLGDLGDDDFARPFDRFGEARLVILGEAAPGVSEFVRARASITRRLIERHGFSLVAVDADWQDGQRIDDYVRHCAGERQGGEAFQAFPRWAWRNGDLRSFVEWLRAWNGRTARARQVSFHGLDVFSLGASIRLVLDTLDRIAPQAAGEARLRYASLQPWHHVALAGGAAELSVGHRPYEREVVHKMVEALAARLDGAPADAAVVAYGQLRHSADRFYRLVYYAAAPLWNLRSRHMYDSLHRLMTARGPRAKAVVWAHNAHAGNAVSTEMGWWGMFSLGELARRSLAADAVLIGLGADSGTVATARDWDGPMEIVGLRPAHPESYERLFVGARRPRFLLEVGAESYPEIADLLAEPRLERAIGAVYRPERELAEHYFEADLVQQFDAFVWFDEVRAVTPLPVGRPRNVASNYPFGA